MRIFIIGFMGSGKTKRGKKIAKKLGYKFYDLDELIEKKYDKKIPALFKEEGEEIFRKYESEALKEVIAFDNIIVSTGGGTPCFYNNIDTMNKNGITLYLKAEPEFLVSRLLKSKKNNRPLIIGKNKEELIDFINTTLTQREQYYSQAKYIFDALSIKNKEIIKQLFS
jgi:shikimate kinase